MNGIFATVVIPNFNGEETLEETIRSVEHSLNRKKFEVIVVDDCSTDSSLQVLEKISKKDSHLRFFGNKKRMSAAFSRNLGIRNAQGDAIIFVDNDVRLKADSAALLVKSAILNSGIAFPKIVFENKRIMWPASGQEESFLEVSACFAISRKAFKKVGIFDENYGTYMEDSDFFLRCRRAGIKFCYEKKALALHAIPKFYSAEKRYFLENRNLVYGMLKFRRAGKDKGPFGWLSLWKNLACGLFNFRWFDWSHYDRTIDKKDKIRLLFLRHKPISVILGFLLCFVFFAGAFSGFFAYAFRRNVQ